MLTMPGPGAAEPGAGRASPKSGTPSTALITQANHPPENDRLPENRTPGRAMDPCRASAAHQPRVSSRRHAPAPPCPACRSQQTRPALFVLVTVPWTRHTS
jgi:hypothetical protein